MMKLNSQHGFSLAELIVVLQFWAILAVIAVPNMNSFYAQYQLSSASSQVAFDITRARMQAIGQNQYVHIQMLSTGTQYVRQTSTDGNNWVNTVTKTLPSRVTSSTTSAEVRFDKRGMATVYNSITVSNTLNQSKTISTSIVGRVTIG